jgi:hypothetical protein
MSGSIFTTRPGVTDPITVYLGQSTADGTKSTFDATGFTSAIWRMWPKGGTEHDYSTEDDDSQLALSVPTDDQLAVLEALDITDADDAMCLATWTPAAGDLDAANRTYEFYVRVTLGGVVYDFPSSDVLMLRMMQGR